MKEKLWTPLLAVGMAAVLFDEAVLSGFWTVYPRWAHAFGNAGWWHAVLAGAYAAGLLVGSIAAPQLLRRVGLKKVAILAVSICAAGDVLFWFPGGPVAACTSHFVLGIGSGLIWVGMFGWIAGQTPESRRGETFGWIYSAATVGGMTGALLGGAAAHVGLFLFALTAVPLVATAACAWAIPGETQHRAPAPGWKRRFAKTSHARHGALLTGLNVALYMIVSAVSSLKLAHFGYGGLAIGVCLALQACVSSASAPVLGRISDRLGVSRTLEFSLAAAFLFLIALAFTHGLVFFSLMIAAGAVFKSPAVIGGIRMMQAAAETGLDQAFAMMALNIVWALAGIPAAALLTSLPGFAAPYLVAATLVGAVMVAVSVRPRLVED